MLRKRITLYAIPGWGFCSSIFKSLNNDELNIIGLDYVQTSLLSLESIAQYLSDKLPDNAALLGWSFGGLIAIALAALFPQKIKKLILISSQPKLISDDNWLGIDPNNAHHFVKEFTRSPSQQMEQFIRLISYPTPSSTLKRILHKHLLAQHTEQLILLLSILLSTDLRDVYQTLDMNILHMVNNQDAVTTQNAIQLQRLNPNARVISFKDTGHAGFLTDQTAYIEVIKNFLENEY